jgi:hypothetical protein
MGAALTKQVHLLNLTQHNTAAQYSSTTGHNTRRDRRSALCQSKGWTRWRKLRSVVEMLHHTSSTCAAVRLMPTMTKAAHHRAATKPTTAALSCTRCSTRCRNAVHAPTAACHPAAATGVQLCHQRLHFCHSSTGLPVQTAQTAASAAPLSSLGVCVQRTAACCPLALCLPAHTGGCEHTAPAAQNDAFGIIARCRAAVAR